MNDAVRIYNGLLEKHPVTLKDASLDSSGSEPVYMTECESILVNFDKFKDKYFSENSSPASASCDALYFDGTEFHLIEFRNGSIREKDRHKIHYKIYESLLLMLAKLDATISFANQNINFIFVYNEEKNPHSENNPYSQIVDGVNRRAQTHSVRFGLRRFEHWFKRVLTLNENQFNKEFVSLM
jgi:hypothetical protein